MKRKNFMQIIKLRSTWRIDKRKGNYELLNGTKLSDYIAILVESQMQIDNLGIRENGDLCFCQGGNWNPGTKEFDDYILMPAFEDNEVCDYDKMQKRIEKLVWDIVR